MAYIGQDLIIIGIVLALLIITWIFYVNSKNKKVSKFFKKILNFLQDLG